ncbi:MAG: hypothetical protein WC795_02120 [Candidatus Paceibacterota bacterium]|jgi:hypothetical protein
MKNRLFIKKLLLGTIIVFVISFSTLTVVAAEQWYFADNPVGSNGVNGPWGSQGECATHLADYRAANPGPGITDCYTNYKLLAPLPGLDQVNSQTSLGDYLAVIYKVGIGIAIALAVVMLVLGAMQYSTSEIVSSKEDGKNKMWNAIWGLLLAVGSYLILSTINPDLLKFNLNIETAGVTLNANEDGLNTPTTEADGNKYFCKGRAGVSGYGYQSGSDWFDDAPVRAVLLEKGITVSGSATNNNCTKVGQTGCTSVYQFQGGGSLLALKNACGGASCQIVITGGTECWLHQTHAPGSSVVDLRETPSLSAYVKKGTKTEIPWAKGKAVQYQVGTTRFVDEIDHFHVKNW